jgi:hypothetical protein
MQEKIYDYAVASRNREHLCDSSERSTCAGNVPPMHPEWIGVDTDPARVQYGGRLRRAWAYQRIT